MEVLRKFRNELGLLIAIVIVLGGTAIFSDAYHSWYGLKLTSQMILRESALVGIFALGAAVVIISGGIDLSAGSVIAFSGTLFFCVLLLLAPENPALPITGQPDVAKGYIADWFDSLDQPVDDDQGDGKLTVDELRDSPLLPQFQAIKPELTDAKAPGEDVAEPPYLDKYDFDHRDLRRIMLEQLIAEYDTDGTVTLSKEELEVLAKGGTDRLMQGLDRDRDDALSLEEMSFQYLPNTEDLSVATILIALLVTLLAAFLVGTLHTWLITRVNLPPFVATLASLVGIRSLARLMIQDLTEIRYGQRQSTVGIEDELLTSISSQGWWVPLVLWLFLAGVLWLLLSRTVIGRHLYAMGGNEEAARLSGIRTDNLKWLAYCISSVTAAIAGVLYACYIGTSSPSSDGMGYELNAIAAAVVGGCSLTGGVGTIAGVMLGTVFLRLVIDSVAKLFKSQPDLLEGLIVGVLVVLAVAINALQGSRGGRQQFFPGLFGWLNVFILSLLSGLMTAVTATDNKLSTGLMVGIGAAVLLSAKAIAERMAERSEG